MISYEKDVDFINIDDQTKTDYHNVNILDMRRLCPVSVHLSV